VHMPSGDYERSLRSILHITPLLAEVLGNKSAVAVLGGFFATKKAPSVDQVFLYFDFARCAMRSMNCFS